MVLNQLTQLLRRLRRAPLFTAITLLTLAIGIGANTAIFSVVRGVLLKPLPYPEGNALVGVWEKAPGLGISRLEASPATYFTYREENHTLEDIGMWRRDSVSVTGVSEPEQIRALDVTDGILPLLRVQPVLGRRFSRQDDTSGSPRTVILTYGYWQRRFGGDRGVLGRGIVMDGTAREVIGVMPEDFRFLDVPAQVILPMQIDRAKIFIGNFSYEALTRLKPGVSMAQANADEARMIAMLPSKFPPPPGMTNKMLEDARLGPNMHPLKDDVVGDVGKVLWVLMATVGIVLFIACANVANLLLVRAEGRQQELAIRAALGAGWSRIAKELLLESVTLGLIGGALGLGIAYGAIQLLVSMGPANLPRLGEIAIDPVVLLFTVTLSLVCGILFGLVPVFKYAGPRLGTVLREGGRSVSEGRERHRARSILVVVQVALALVLLISSGLMIRSFQSLRKVQPGFEKPDQILTMRISILTTQVPEIDRVLRMQNDVLDKISAIPGTASASLTNAVTMDGNTDNDLLFVEDHPPAEGKMPPIRRYKFVAPGFFQTMQRALVAGRDFSWDDNYQHRDYVMISENVAREYWGQPSAAIGKRVRETPNLPWYEIIGVVGNERDDGVDRPAPKIIYWPLVQRQFVGGKLDVIRTGVLTIRNPRAGTSAFLNEVRQAIWSVNPDLPLANVRTEQEIYDKSMGRTSFLLVMLALASGMALLLGLIGIYGVISYSVSQRTREIGIRMALGASEQNVQQMFVRHGLLLTVIGLVCGMLAAFAVTRLMTSLLFGVGPLDPVTYVVVPTLLACAALAASYFPARRATHIDPSDALRSQ
jgi:predicted permease